MKTKVFPFCIILFIISSSIAQETDTIYVGDGDCCPYIGSLEVSPRNPTINDSIKLILKLTTPAQGAEIYKSHQLVNDTIKITTCHWEGIAASPETFIDTFLIGLLESKTYNIELICYSSIDMNCTINDTVIGVTTLSITETGIVNSFQERNITLVYPNPITSNFKLSLFPIDFSKITIYNLLGEEMITFDQIKPEYDISFLKDGIYVISIIGRNSYLNKKILKCY